MSKTKKLERDSRVVFHSFGTRRHGIIVKISKVTAQVLFDGAEEPERMYIDSLRLETAEDVSKRDHERAMRAWRDDRPECSVARVDYCHSYHHSNQETGATVVAKTPAEMRQAASELAALAAWFEQRPTAPSNEGPR